MSADAGAAKAEGAAGKKLDLGKILLPLFALLNFAVLGGGAFLVYSSTIGYHHPSVREPAAFKELEKAREGKGFGDAVLYTMPVFTANLAGAPRRMIRIEMTFDMLDKEGFEEIVRSNPVVRDEIMRILNRKTFDEIETIQGKLFLKDQIAVTLNKNFKSGVIKDIYFNEFLVQ
jgi:flagellar FliL protein